MVRANKTDTNSEEPAWVKADYGGGEYGIKMVSNTKGKLRRVQWKHLFRDGSFNKLQISGRGARVRTTERMREIEQGKAEAKFAGKLKEKQIRTVDKSRNKKKPRNRQIALSECWRRRQDRQRKT